MTSLTSSWHQSASMAPTVVIVVNTHQRHMGMERKGVSIWRTPCHATNIQTSETQWICARIIFRWNCRLRVCANIDTKRVRSRNLNPKPTEIHAETILVFESWPKKKKNIENRPPSANILNMSPSELFLGPNYPTTWPDGRDHHPPRNCLVVGIYCWTGKLFGYLAETNSYDCSFDCAELHKKS